MKRIFTLLFLSILLIGTANTASAQGDHYQEKARTITVTAAGTLESYFSTPSDKEVNRLTVEGPLNEKDLRFLGTLGRYPHQLHYLNLTNAHFTSVPKSCFHSGIALFEVELPEEVTEIGDSAFYWCNAIGSLPVTKNTVKIGKYAYCKAGQIDVLMIPKSVTEIGEGAFCDWYGDKHVGMRQFTVEEGNSVFSFDGGLLINKNTQTVLACNPDIDHQDSDDKVLTIPEGIKRLGDCALQSAYFVKKLELPASLTELGYEVFNGMYKSEEITVAAGNTAFEVIDGVLYNKDKTIVYRAPTMKKTPKPYTLEPTVVEIAAAAFAQSKLKAVKLPEGLQIIGDHAFDNSYLEETSIPKTVKKIGIRAFMATGLEGSITVPEGVTELPEGAFAYNYSLEELTLPSTLKKLGDDVFSMNGQDTSDQSFTLNCYALTPPAVTTATFNNLDGFADVTLHVVNGCKKDYKKARGWKDFTIVENLVKVATAIVNPTQIVYEVARYTLGGARISTPVPGVNIIKYSDGTTRKVIVR